MGYRDLTGRIVTWAGFLASAIWTTIASADTAEISRRTANIDGKELPVFVYQPRGCAAPSILIIFHGNSRTARSYLRGSIPLADEGCFSVYAPRFSKESFPNWAYHRGGLLRAGKLRPEEEWTVEMIGDLVDWAQEQNGDPDAPVYLFGHSAGGQFLSRVAAYAMPDEVARIIIANPSTYVLPTEEEQIPYGYGGMPDSFQPDRRLREYLAAPVTIYLGQKDTGRKSLVTTDEAMRQGDNRLTRGERTYEMARKIAESRGLPFNWRLVRAEDVGHSARGMLQAHTIGRAMGF